MVFHRNNLKPEPVLCGLAALCGLTTASISRPSPEPAGEHWPVLADVAARLSDAQRDTLAVGGHGESDAALEQELNGPVTALKLFPFVAATKFLSGRTIESDPNL